MHMNIREVALQKKKLAMWLQQFRIVAKEFFTLNFLHSKFNRTFSLVEGPLLTEYNVFNTLRKSYMHIVCIYHMCSLYTRLNTI